MEKILIKDGEKDFKLYLSRFDDIAGVINSFAKEFEEIFADLKVKFDADWLGLFYNGSAKNKLSSVIDEHVKTVPNSLKEHVLEYNWKLLNEFLPRWNIVFNKFQNFANPIGTSFPGEATNIKVIPFNIDGRVQMNEEFKTKIRPQFDLWAINSEVVPELQKVADVFNYLAKRISEGKAHQNVSLFTLRRTAPIFIQESSEGQYILNSNYINSF